MSTVENFIVPENMKLLPSSWFIFLNGSSDSCLCSVFLLILAAKVLVDEFMVHIYHIIRRHCMYFVFYYHSWLRLFFLHYFHLDRRAWFTFIFMYILGTTERIRVLGAEQPVPTLTFTRALTNCFTSRINCRFTI